MSTTRRRAAGTVLVVALGATALAACGSDSSDTAKGKDGADTKTVTLVTHDSFAVSKPVLRGVHEADRLHGQGPASAATPARWSTRRSSQGQPARRRRCSASTTRSCRARSTRASSSRTPRRASADGAGRAPARPAAPRHADRLRRRVRQLRQGVVRARRPRPRRTTLDDLPSPRTRTCSSSRTRRRRRRASPSCSRRSPQYGDRRLAGLLEALRANGVQVVDGWTQAYDTDFTGGGGKGDRPLVVSLRIEPAGRGRRRRPAADETPTSVSSPATCFRQVEFAGVLQGAKQRRRARRRSIDFMLARRSRRTCRSRCTCTRS